MLFQWLRDFARRVAELAFMGFLFFLFRNVMSAISVAQARRVAELAFMGFLFFLFRNVMSAISVVAQLAFMRAESLLN